jgi:hypothetical protein
MAPESQNAEHPFSGRCRYHVKNLRLFAAVLVIALCDTSCSHGGSSVTPSKVPPVAAALGGSNYGWYFLGPGCSREPYGVVYNYDTATATIDSQLQQMYSNGQRRLRIPV